MRPEELKNWVMEMRPGRKLTREWLTPETCAVAIASGGGTYEGSIERTEGTREFIWALELNHVWVCHTDLSRDQYVPSKGETIQRLIFPDGWIPNDLDCQLSYRSANTRTQALWVIEKLKERPNVRHLLASASWYHGGRWALTLAQAAHEQAVQNVKISVLPTPNHTPIKGSRVSQTDLEEITRIEDYQNEKREGGAHVATYDIARPYFE